MDKVKRYNLDAEEDAFGWHARAEEDANGIWVEAEDHDRVVAERQKRIEKLEAALKNLSERHNWQPDMGECICAEHKAAREALKGDG